MSLAEDYMRPSRFMLARGRETGLDARHHGQRRRCAAVLSEQLSIFRARKKLQSNTRREAATRIRFIETMRQQTMTSARRRCAASRSVLIIASLTKPRSRPFAPSMKPKVALAAALRRTLELTRRLRRDAAHAALAYTFIAPQGNVRGARAPSSRPQAAEDRQMMLSPPV